MDDLDTGVVGGQDDDVVVVVGAPAEMDNVGAEGAWV